VDVGLVSTPLFNFACTNYPEHFAGIMVTASHNPAKYNGFKMTLGSGLPVGGGSGMEVISELAEKNNFTDSEQKGSTQKKEVLNDYFDKILSIIKPSEIKPLKIVIDAGNGMANATFPKLLERLTVDVEYMYLKPDGNFPNHEANPLKVETLKDLQKRVVEAGADFGFALDGDADRVGLVDEKGEVVDASFVGTLVGLEVLRDYPKSTMLYDLRSSKIIRDKWEEAGANVGMCPVGHAKIKKIMKDKNAKFASELSMHLYFNDMHNLESGDLSLLYILRMLSRENKKLSELTAPLRKYAHSGEINFEIKNKDAIFEKLKNTFADAEISDMDGLLFTFPTWWFGVRASNTEPVLRLILEANTGEEMKKRLNEVKKIIQG
jgi:phosphomannomutase